jgi:opacity protein-like surface antigen
MRKRLMVAALAAALAASRAGAIVGDTYVALRAGAYLPRGAAWSAYGSSLGLEVAGGAQLLPFLAGEVSVGRVSVQSGGYTFQAPGGGEVTGTETLSLVPFTVALRAEIPTGFVRPYALAGAAVAFVRLARDWATGTLHDSATSVAWQLGLGARTDLGSRIFAAVEGRWTLARIHVFGEAREMDSLGIFGGLGYRF